MKRVAVSNLKGGIGKTTTAVSLAVILAAEHKKRVLLVDCDMQGNASKVLGQYRAEGIGTHTVMQQKTEPEYCIFKTDYPRAEVFGGNLDIIPSNMYLMQANAAIMQDTEHEQLHILDNAIKRLEEMGQEWTDDTTEHSVLPYDIVIFDCALGLDMTVLNAVIASDLIIAPVPFGGYEIDGLGQLQEQLEDLKTINENLRMKVLFTMKQGNKANREFYQWLHENSGYNVFNEAITRSIVAQKATLEEMPLPVFSRNGTATKNYRAVAAELLDDLEEIGSGKE